ncbi:MAG: endonuclease/exonuclease/phosphatase family protein [Planctomycetaceae bacterium]
MSTTPQPEAIVWTAGLPRRPLSTARELADPRQRRYARWTLWAAVLNLLLTLLAVILIREVSENWWLTGTLIFVPQLLLLLPSLCLFIASLFFNVRAALVNTLCLALILVSLCGLRCSMQSFQPVLESSRNIRVLTCNVQNFEPDFSKVMREISRSKPDIVAFQEAQKSSPEMLTGFLEGWEFLHAGEFWIGSRWPVRLVGVCTATPYDNRMTALKVEIRTPNGPVILSNVHLMTARRGLAELSLGSMISGEGPASVEHHSFLRYEEARQTLSFLRQSDVNQPQIVVGDFNMPVTSNIYTEHFGSWINAFDVSGFGFGYSAPCRRVRFWISDTPWLRIDHVLTSKHFDVMRCDTGELNGSDHRVVCSVLKLKTSSEQPK